MKYAVKVAKCSSHSCLQEFKINLLGCLISLFSTSGKVKECNLIVNLQHFFWSKRPLMTVQLFTLRCHSKNLHTPTNNPLSAGFFYRISTRYHLWTQAKESDSKLESERCWLLAEVCAPAVSSAGSMWWELLPPALQSLDTVQIERRAATDWENKRWNRSESELEASSHRRAVAHPADTNSAHLLCCAVPRALGQNCCIHTENEALKHTFNRNWLWAAANRTETEHVEFWLTKKQRPHLVGISAEAMFPNSQQYTQRKIMLLPAAIVCKCNVAFLFCIWS